MTNLALENFFATRKRRNTNPTYWDCFPRLEKNGPTRSTRNFIDESASQDLDGWEDDNETNTRASEEEAIEVFEDDDDIDESDEDEEDQHLAKKAKGSQKLGEQGERGGNGGRVINKLREVEREGSSSRWGEERTTKSSNTEKQGTWGEDFTFTVLDSSDKVIDVSHKPERNVCRDEFFIGERY